MMKNALNVLPCSSNFP